MSELEDVWGAMGSDELSPMRPQVPMFPGSLFVSQVSLVFSFLPELPAAHILAFFVDAMSVSTGYHILL